MLTKHAIIDLDLYKYTAATAGEKRTVLVTHRSSGRSREFNNRTEFYGHWKKKEGGWLAEVNKKRTSPFMPDEFDYTDIQTPDKLENVLYSAKSLVERDLEACGAESYKGFIGVGESFRVGLSTLQEYKGERPNLKPFYLQEVTDYLAKRYRAEFVADIEADDAVVIECYNNPNNFCLIEDKDYWGTPINVWDRNQQSRGIVDCKKFGHLYLDAKDKVRGEGRIFLYFQTLSADKVDCYSASVFSDKRWGDKSAYKALVDCKTDEEALEALVSSYKYLYPEPKVVQGWRGEDIEIDWHYVANENFNMARMLRWKGDSLTFDEVLEGALYD